MLAQCRYELVLEYELVMIMVAARLPQGLEHSP